MPYEILYSKKKTDSDFLMHHGIKGQKWGEQNGPPYPLREYSQAEIKANKKLANQVKKLEKSKASDRYSKLNKVINTSNQLKTALNSDKVNEARKDLLKEQQKIKDFYENDKLSDKYLTLAAIIATKDYGDINDTEELNNMIRLYKYEDFNQGYGTAYQLYLLDNDKSTQSGFNARKKYDNAVKETLDDIMGEYGNIVVNDIPKLNIKETVNDVITEYNNDYYWTEEPMDRKSEKIYTDKLKDAKKFYNSKFK